MTNGWREKHILSRAEVGGVMGGGKNSFPSAHQLSQFHMWNLCMALETSEGRTMDMD